MYDDNNFAIRYSKFLISYFSIFAFKFLYSCISDEFHTFIFMNLGDEKTQYKQTENFTPTHNNGNFFVSQSIIGNNCYFTKVCFL